MTEIRGSAVLFDLDGVLIDSTPGETRVGRQGGTEHGVDLKKVVARVHDRRSPATVRKYLPSADHAENRAIERRETQGASAITTLPGARELLQFPVKRCTIATSARDRWPKCLSARRVCRFPSGL